MLVVSGQSSMHRPHSKNKTWTNNESGGKESSNGDIAEDPNLPGNRWKHVRFVSVDLLKLCCDVYLRFSFKSLEKKNEPML